MSNVCGIVNINKPTGMTSSDVVITVRNAVSRVIGEKIKSGHLGTLDPGGAGVLPITLGKATRLFDYFLNKDKVYRADFTFGKTTDTLDSYGKIINTSSNIPTQSDIESVLSEFRGKIKQIPPIYSSLSVNGKRAYDLARQGKDFELNAREIEIYSIDVVSKRNDTTYTFDIHTSSGTYIRSIARDLAMRLESCAYMSSIIRLRSGIFDIEGAIGIDEFLEYPLAKLTDIDTALKGEVSLTLSKNDEKRVLTGLKTSLLSIIKNAKNIDMCHKNEDIYNYIMSGKTVVVRLNDGSILGLLGNKDGNVEITARLL